MLLAGLAGPVGAGAHVLEVASDGTVRVRTTVEPQQDLAAADDQSVNGADDPAPEVPAAALTVIEPPAAPPAFQPALEKAAHAAGISPQLLAALVWQESRWNAGAVSPRGAVGLAQLMPATATALAVDPRDPVSNLNGGAAYLRHLLDMFDGDLERALAAYNAGPGRVLRTGGVPPISETRGYVTGILERVSRLDQPASTGDQRQ